MAGVRRAVWVAALMSVWLGGAVAVRAETIPTPTPAPSPIDIIADGQQVVVRDRRLATQDLYPLSQTPLRFLLADKIDLLQDTNVVGVTADDTYVGITIEEKQPFVGTSRLLMMFDSKNLKLKQWTITDVQGFDTTIAVSNLDTSKAPDPNLFRFDYTHLVQ